jgi:hypothetical protein
MPAACRPAAARGPEHLFDAVRTAGSTDAKAIIQPLKYTSYNPGTLAAERQRDAFTDGVETLVSRWLYTT